MCVFKVPLILGRFDLVSLISVKKIMEPAREEAHNLYS